MSGVDRLAELRGEAGVGEEDTSTDATTATATEAADSSDHAADVAEHMKRYDTIKRGLDLIKSNADMVERLRQKNKQTANEKSRKDVMSQMDKIMATTNTYGHAIKQALDEIKAENSTYKKEQPSHFSKLQMRTNLYETHIKKFQAAMNTYNTAAHAFKADLQKRTKRELKIVDSELTEEEVDDIVESGRAQDVIKQALVSENLQDVVRVIEERHADIMRLEQQVLEIYELFRDLAVLVDLQQESLDVIENRIMHAKNYTEKAEVELQEAEEYQKKARNRRCCILIVLLVIVAVILGPTLGKALGGG